MLRRSTLFAGLLVLATGCSTVLAPGSSVDPTPAPASTADDTASPSPTVPQSTEGGSPAPVPTTEPIPTDELGDFTCDLPIVEPATVVGITNYTDVRVGTHDGFDRLVIEFNRGTPDLTLGRDEPPHDEHVSGIPLEVEGQSVLRLEVRNGTAMTESGESSYDGPRDLDPGFPMLVDVVHGSDFEAITNWYIGLADEACVRVTLLTAPDRIVIDFEH